MAFQLYLKATWPRVRERNNGGVGTLHKNVRVSDF